MIGAFAGGVFLAAFVMFLAALVGACNDVDSRRAAPAACLVGLLVGLVATAVSTKYASDGVFGFGVAVVLAASCVAIVWLCDRAQGGKTRP